MLDDKSVEDVKNFIADTNIDFIVAVGKNNFRLSATFGNITSAPYMVIYDKNGKYATDYIGAIPEEMIEADLRRVF
jgi:hypothetical protein